MGKSDPEVKSFDIPKRLVWEAYKSVKANDGAAGVDGQSIEEFETYLKNNLYVGYLSPQGFHRLSQVGSCVAAGAAVTCSLGTPRVWMPSEAWAVRSAMACR